MEELVAAEGGRTNTRIDDDDHRRRRQQQQQERQRGVKEDDGEKGGVVDPATTTTTTVAAAADTIEPAANVKLEIKEEDERGGDNNEDRRGGGSLANNRRGGGGAIPWWILNDDDDGDKRKKKRKKKTIASSKMGKNEDEEQKEKEKEEGEGGDVVAAARGENEEGDYVALVGGASAMANTSPSAPTTGRKDGIEGGGGGNKKAPNHTATTSTPAHTPPSSAISSLSARDRASEFIRTIPIDVAHSTSLRFLVWGCPSSTTRGDGRAVPSSSRDVGGVANGECDEVAIDGGPALLTLPPYDDRASRFRRGGPNNRPMLERESHDQSFERLRTMYDPLLIGLTTTYPGFLPALFVHVVDSILCLEGARHDMECARVGEGGGRRRRRRRSAGDVDVERGGGGGGEVTAPELDDDVGDLGDEDDGTLDLVRLEHHLQYMSRWVRYVLSRAFHMHLDKSVASWSTPENEDVDVGVEVVVEEQQERITRPSKPCESSGEPTSTDGAKSPLQQQQSHPQRRQPIDLKKRGKKKWTAAQHLYMQGPLEYTYLHEMVGLPLNSVCDRILIFRQQRGDFDEVSNINGGGTTLASSSSSNITKTATTAAISVVGQLHQYLEDVIGKEERVIFMGICDDNGDRHEIRKEWERSSDANQMPANVGDDGRTNEITSEMEEEVSKDREEESAPPQAKRQKKLSLEEMESIFEDDAHTMMHVDSVAPRSSTHALNGGNADNSTGESINDDSLFHIKPWTLCKGWDACAIGTMPGYPS